MVFSYDIEDDLVSLRHRWYPHITSLYKNFSAHLDIADFLPLKETNEVPRQLTNLSQELLYPPSSEGRSNRVDTLGKPPNSNFMTIYEYYTYNS